MPRPITTSAIAPNDRNSTVWKVLTHAVPRMPPKKTYDITTSATTAPPSQYGTSPPVIAAQRRPAAHHADDDVGHEQRGLQREDDRADVPALPPVAEHLHRRHEAVALAERPHPRADEEEGQRNHERRRRTPSGRT